jgi:hypothetical protein
MYVMRKIKNQELYTIKNKDTGAVHSNRETYEDAKKRIRLLNGIVKKSFGGKKN